ncbi:asparagine synthase (glutamine-hydrolyzing) [Allosphingosinicella sp.]|jgi:asparagine synthase (glutamine-hydrolysing)|uniref:asparagine synthase (glutamine-hydrolyzing) n=1 Tax=Allosphingosinicella sp. TaxID=2823234 RepID=UPI002EE073CA
MCGIAGFIDLAGARSPAENDRLALAMRDSIRHRGPDAAGLWSNPEAGVWLAHRRLSIIDLSEAGAQPMATPDGRAHIVYNGEAYNFAELRPELEAAGYRFRGHSDTEVLLYGCHHWGVEKTVGHLGGMFAFAYWDSSARTLTLVRDRLGKKPLYWAKTPRGFLFASELTPLMLHPDCPRAIDRSSVSEYLRTHYIGAPHSIFEGVEKLGPGEMLTFDTRSGEVTRGAYWSVRGAAERGFAAPFQGSPEEAVDEAETLISDSTRIRMVSDVPLGAFLSGGIDSSTVVAMMQRHGGGSARTFSIGYSDSDYDEAVHARAVARHLGTSHTELILEPSDALAVVPELARMFDEPFGDMSQIPTFLVSKLARQHVTVALSGDGGDELFAGYNRHIAAGGLLKRLARLPRPARAAMAKAIRALPPDRWQALLRPLPAKLRPRAVGEKLHKLAGAMTLPEGEQYRRIVSQWDDPESVVIDGPERPGPAEDPELRAAFPDSVAYMRYLDLVTWLPGDVLTKVDRASMAVSLEARAPLLDHRLVEFSFRIPSSLHLRNGEGKWLLRRVLERSVPRALFERPKMGFGIPMGQWLRGPLRDWAEELLSERRLRATGFLRPEPVRALWQRHLRSEVNAQYQLWPVLMLLAWCEAHAKLAPASPARELARAS